MKIVSMLYANIIIFFSITMILPIKLDASSEAEFPPQSKANNPSSEPSQTPNAILPTLDPPDVDSTSSKTSKNPALNILSPELLSQTYPFDYMLSKTTDLSVPKLRNMRHNVKYLLDRRQIAKTYRPYAKVLYSLLECQLFLGDALQRIHAIQYTAKAPYPALESEIYVSDPELAGLFSSEIFTDADPMARLIYKLLDIPESQVESVEKRLDVLSKNGHIPELYSKYCGKIRGYLGGSFTKYDLLQLRRNIANLQRVILFASDVLPKELADRLEFIYF